MRLKQYSRSKPCYYCGAPGPSTQEHAPPKLMFASFDCDSITVPSCKTHNNEKSDKDRAIITWLIKSIHRAIESGFPIDSVSLKVIKAIDDLKPYFAQANREVSDHSFLNNPELDFKIPAVNVSAYDWIHQLTAALIWSVAGEFDPSIKWSESLVWSPLYIENTGSMELIDRLSQLVRNQISERHIESFDWKTGWSAFPRAYPQEIYNFRVCFSPTLIQKIDLEVAFRHQFYGSLNWYVWFTPSQQTRQLLEKAVATLNMNNVVS